MEDAGTLRDVVDALTPSMMTTVNAIGVQAFCPGLWLSSQSQFSFPTSRVTSIALSSPNRENNWTPRGSTTPVREMGSPFQRAPVAHTPPSKPLGHGNSLSQLQPAQVTMLRDSFQILDRDCDGVVNREDVADMLAQLGTGEDMVTNACHSANQTTAGLPSNPSDVSHFFPPSQPQTIALAAFLNSLADKLAALSASSELMSAFSAFDEDDSGQVDLADLRDALLNTAPEPGERPLTAAEVDKVINGFTGRRAFNKNMNAQLGAKRGDVFRYQEFVNSIMGSNGGSGGSSQENSEG
ncbi:unnamed protein product [Clonostachys rosea]|uniref:EF-hand domain-containing protein n=1 Tax=Bionectria ochroleuca TaxID=29856 RepID=A0ABY6ULL9_BIOOC|nr:unnamed protein product [Clonostachys rosea]